MCSRVLLLLKFANICFKMHFGVKMFRKKLFNYFKIYNITKIIDKSYL